SPHAIVANVFSNIGEPVSVPAIAERPPRVVVFGGGGASAIAHQRGSEIRNLFEMASIREIVEIGRTPPSPVTVFGVPVVAKGMLSQPEVSQLLLTSRLGVLPYGNRSVLGKSGILAAYAAHGVVPVALKVTHKDSDGLVAGVHYLVASKQVAAAKDFAAMQQNLRTWYAGHSLSLQAQRLAAIIKSASGGIS